MVNPPTITIAGVELDPAIVGLPIEIAHGRADHTVQPDPPTASFLLYGRPPAGVNLNDPVTIRQIVNTGGAGQQTWASTERTWADDRTSWEGGATLDLPRFSGRVASVDVARDVGDPDVYRVSCLGEMAALARTMVTLSRPDETDHERVAAIAAAAGVTITIRGTTTIGLHTDNIERPALAALHEVCASSGAILWENLDGSITYGTNDHRAGEPTVTRLSAAEVYAGVTWHRNTANLINHVTVEYGPASNRKQLTVSDAGSVAEWGQQHADVATQCRDPDDASELAQTILGRRRNPIWTVDVVETASAILSVPAYRDLSRVKIGGPIAVPVPESPVDAGTEPQVWSVEGYAQVYEHDKATGRLEHIFGLVLVDRELWGVPILRTYGELAAEMTYADTPALTYLDLLIREIAT